MRDQFVLSDEILKIQEDDAANYYIPNETEIAGKSDQDLARYLNEIADSIQVSSDNITDPLVFDRIRSFLKYFTSVSPRILSRLFDIVLSAFRVEIKSTEDDLDNNEKNSFSNHKLNLELYGYLVHWLLLSAEANATSSKMVKKAKASTSTSDLKTFDWSNQKLKAFDLASWLLDLKLLKIWTLTPDRVNFVTLFTKPAYQIFENPAHAKEKTIKDRVFRILSLCIKNYDHLFVAQTTIMQNLQYWEHSAEPMAELLVYMVENENYTQLADEILREVSNREFKDATSKEVKDSPNPRTFTAFLRKLVELSPKTILKNMVMLINQLGSESYLMRVAIIEILGSLIIELDKTANDNPNHTEQINGFFDILEERMLDTNAYVRQKVLTVYLRILALKSKFPKRRYALTLLAIRHLKDKSSYVRKNAIKVLTALVSTHPYGRHGGELDLEDWIKKLNELKEGLENVTTEDDVRALAMASELEKQTEKQNDESEKDVDTEKDADIEKDANTEKDADTEKDVDTEMTDADADQDKENQPTEEKEQASTSASEQQQQQSKPITEKRIVSAEVLQQLELMREYHVDAIKFIEQIDKAIPIITLLLSSKSKPEVLECMEFLVVAYNYKLKAAAAGVKKMLHLIWTKDTSDEGKGIKMKLLSCFENLYLLMDAKESRLQNISRIAQNLVKLTYDTNLAELTSLEQVLSTLMSEDKIPLNVIDKLWSAYEFDQKKIDSAKKSRDEKRVNEAKYAEKARRGAIMILGMLAKAKTRVVSEKIDSMLKVGLGPTLSKTDLSLAKYTCVALQRLTGVKTKDKGRGVQEGIRFPISHPIFPRLKAVIDNPGKNAGWISLSEEIINTIYLLCEQPEILCESIIRGKTIKVFDLDKTSSASPPPSLNSSAMAIDYDLSMNQQSLPYPQQPLYKSSMEVAQLLHIVGHIAFKQIVHLEVIEAAWKRKKAKKESDNNGQKDKTEVEDELEQVGGTAEDDIGEHIAKIREREMLFGNNSLLARFGPIIKDVCAHNKLYTDRTLQIAATLALGKFMCVSSEFCEKNLQLLFTILEKSKDATIRSNIVIALGDMAVSFSTLIDENITFLYNRLSDEDPLVRKNTVMVLTHLILNGMVKVKGQISEMAKCLEDPDQRIVDLAKQFFTELASKDNAIYNNLPDIISNLTSSQPPRLEEESFQRIMKFIFSFDFADNSKQAENIVDKLCQRFLTAEDERNWRDIAFCLSLLPFKSEKAYKKLLEGWPSYQDKIHEDAVHKSFLDIIQKGRLQKTQKPELKPFIDELEQKVEKQRGPEVVEKPEKSKPTKKVGRAVKSNQKKKKEVSVQPVKRDLRKRKRVIEESEDEEEDEDEDEDEDEEESEEEIQLDDEDEPQVSDNEEKDEEMEVIKPRRLSKKAQQKKKKEDEEEEEEEEGSEEEMDESEYDED